MMIKEFKNNLTDLKTILQSWTKYMRQTLVFM